MNVITRAMFTLRFNRISRLVGQGHGRVMQVNIERDWVMFVLRVSEISRWDKRAPYAIMFDHP
jgi:hypothetical protein